MNIKLFVHHKTRDGSPLVDVSPPINVQKLFKQYPYTTTYTNNAYSNIIVFGEQQTISPEQLDIIQAIVSEIRTIYIYDPVKDYSSALDKRISTPTRRLSNISVVEEDGPAYVSWTVNDGDTYEMWYSGDRLVKEHGTLVTSDELVIVSPYSNVDDILKGGLPFSRRTMQASLGEYVDGIIHATELGLRRNVIHVSYILETMDTPLPVAWTVIYKGETPTESKIEEAIQKYIEQHSKVDKDEWIKKMPHLYLKPKIHVAELSLPLGDVDIILARLKLTAWGPDYVPGELQFLASTTDKLTVVLYDHDCITMGYTTHNALNNISEVISQHANNVVHNHMTIPIIHITTPLAV